MALLFVDGFDHYATADIGKKWNNQGGTTLSIASAASRSASGQGLRINTNASCFVQRGFASLGTVLFGVACRVGAAQSGNFGLLALLDGATYQIFVATLASGAVRVCRGNSMGVNILAESAGGVVSLNAWFYIEVKATMATGATGSVVVHVNGQEVINVTGVQTAASGAAQANSFLIFGQSTGINLDFDDVYVASTLGGGVADFIGDVRVDTQLPDADGSTLNWTPSTGNAHWSLLDENPPNTTDYVSSNTANNIDSYSFTALTGSGTIFGVAVNLTSTLSDAGARTLTGYAKSGSNVSTGGSHGVSYGSWTDVQDIFELDPQGNAAWTVSRVNAAEFGEKLVA